MKIEGAVVFVTGANRGLGLEFAKQALARGARKVYASSTRPRSRAPHCRTQRRLLACC